MNIWTSKNFFVSYFKWSFINRLFWKEVCIFFPIVYFFFFLRRNWYWCSCIVKCGSVFEWTEEVTTEQHRSINGYRNKISFLASAELFRETHNYSLSDTWCTVVLMLPTDDDATGDFIPSTQIDELTDDKGSQGVWKKIEKNKLQRVIL